MLRIRGVESAEPLSHIDRMYVGIHPEDRSRVRATYEAAQKQKGEFDAEYRIVLRDGTIKHLYTIGHPVLNESGAVIEYIGTGIDVTEQKEARAALEHAFEEIKRLKDRLQDENVALREEIDQAFMFEEIVGASAALKTVLSHVANVAPTESTLLIFGETGTGKELIARAIHKHSRRAERAFVSLNCAATPPSLIASELFGHERARSPVRFSSAAAVSNWRTQAPSSSTKSARFRWIRRSRCCACCKSVRSSGLAGAAQSLWTSG